MLTFLDTITGLIAPHECLACGYEGSPLCNVCVELLPQPVPRCYRCASVSDGWNTCARCRKQSSLQRVIVATPYEGFAEILVRKLKFERMYAAHVPVGRALKQHVSSQTVFVPVPTAATRVRQRGYDQAVLIARSLARQANGSCVQALDRRGNQRQTGSGRQDRLHQLEGAFSVRSKKLNGIESVTLVDDVLTTGATFEAAAHALRLAGMKHIDAIAFARSE